MAAVLLITLIGTSDIISSTSGMYLFLFIAVLALVSVVGGSNTSNVANEKNLIENVKTVYEIDKLVFDGNIKPGTQGSIDVTVTADGKAFKAILTEDEKTFEPRLSIFESPVNTDFDIESLKK